MEWRDEGLLLSVRRHGERGAIIEVLTAAHGRHAGLVQGGGGVKLSAALQPGASLQLDWRARIEEHLGMFRVELIRSRAAPIMAGRARLAALNAMAAMVLTSLAEREPDPALYARSVDLADALAENRRDWPAVYARWELALLAALGFGLDLERCAASGLRSDLAYVSPRTGRAVSRSAGSAWADRLLPLPAFLIDRGPPTMGGVREAMRLTGYFLETWMLPAFGHETLPGARQRLVEIFASHEMPPPPEEAPRDDEAEYHRDLGQSREILLPGA
ncbi:DNA repair protein RecO [Paralimibaculum aggregatum]|uniref:DNA repair protein RecO n=1 Tax=Paralimibaculum aggregatum TaxID=3036245 RepID=A0ABQ6LC47_9RHOB|nr:DNA repair protein RecO [Limibaculum sp. NKW23]GMG80970.1 DNA repair protein RecO [Limibaculum sp. NKW23]